MGRKLRSSTLNRLEEEQRTRGTRQPASAIDDPDDVGARATRRATRSTRSRQLSQYLGGVRGRRKALVLFSEGIDYDINDSFNKRRRRRTIMDSTRDADRGGDARQRRHLRRRSARARAAWRDEAIEIAVVPGRPDARPRHARRSTTSMRLAQDSLRVLSDETGGFAVVNTNDFATAFQRIVDDNSSYYVLGYYPTNERRDGRFRKIEVRVDQARPDASARRSGYVAPRGRAPEPSRPGPNDASRRTARSDGQPAAGRRLPMAATAARLQGAGAERVGRRVDADRRRRRCRWSRRTGMFRNDVELAVDGGGPEGQVVPGDRNTLNLKMKPDTVPRVRARWASGSISQLDLPPGRYSLRIGAREANTKKRRLGLVRPRGAGLREGAAVDEQPRADLGGQLDRRRRRGRRIRCASCCPGRSPAIASSRRTTSSRSSPRSTTARPTAHKVDISARR